MAFSEISDGPLRDKSVLRPVAGLTAALSKNDLERVAINAIKKHRRLRDVAEACEQPPIAIRTGEEAPGEVRLAYIEAMIDMHAQRMVVSTLLDLLGYSPRVPEDP